MTNPIFSSLTSIPVLSTVLPAQQKNNRQEISPTKNVKQKNSTTTSKNSFQFFTKDRLVTRDTYGKFNGKNFYITHKNNFLKNDKITGMINGEKVDITINELPVRENIAGTIGDKKLNLTLITTLEGKEISGTYNNKPVKMKLKRGLNTFSLENEKTKLHIHRHQLFLPMASLKGQYSGDEEILPILINEIYCIRNSEFASVATAFATIS